MTIQDPRQAGDKMDDVEVTPEMVAAGAEAVSAYDPRFEDAATAAEGIFRSMMKARKAATVCAKSDGAECRI